MEETNRTAGCKSDGSEFEYPIKQNARKRLLLP
jgi:hypothetical protein